MRKEIIPGYWRREVVGEDGASLAALVERCFEEYAEEGVLFDPKGVDADLFEWASHLAKYEGEGWIVEDADGNCMAMIGYVCVEDNLFEIKCLYVDAALRGKRLAVKLLDMVERRIISRGGELLIAWSDTRFTRAHSFYRREGYSQMTMTRDLHDISQSVEYQFIKAL